MGNIEGKIVVVVSFLVLAGLLFVYSASFPRSMRLFGHPFGYLERQLFGAIIGFVMLVVLWRVDYHFWEKIDHILLIGAFFLCLLTLIPGVATGERWISFGPVSFQPTEFAKLALLVYICGSLVRRQDRICNFSQGVLPHLTVVGAFGLVLALQPNFGMVLVYTAVTVFLLWVGGIPGRHLLLTALGAIPIGGILVLAAPYRMGRLLAFLNPSAYQDTYAWQVFQSLSAIGAGGVFGRGIGASRAKLFYLPSAHNDFVFSVVAEEVGLFGALIVIALFATLVALGVMVAMRAGDLLGRLYALGASFLLGFQAFLNLGVAVGILPVTGLPLPFLSYGGSSLAVSLALVGLILGVAGQGVR